MNYIFGPSTLLHVCLVNIHLWNLSFSQKKLKRTYWTCFFGTTHCNIKDCCIYIPRLKSHSWTCCIALFTSATMLLPHSSTILSKGCSESPEQKETYALGKNIEFVSHVLLLMVQKSTSCSVRLGIVYPIVYDIFNASQAVIAGFLSTISRMSLCV